MRPFRLAAAEVTLPRRWVRELDARAMTRGVPGLLLMESAGRGAAELAAELLDERRARGPVVVVCGKGNNGGDGLVVARLLRCRGVDARALLAFEPAGAGADAGADAGGPGVEGDAALNLRAARAVGVPVRQVRDGEALARALSPSPALVVDALLGTGLTGAVRAPYDGLLRAIGGCDAPVLALDLPSGLDADTGARLGPVPTALATATFGARKPGLLAGDGPALAGRVEVIDISLPVGLLDEVVADARAAGELT